MNKPKPVVGQTLFALSLRNNMLDHAQVLTPMRVVSVGKKYFYCVRESLIKPDGSWWKSAEITFNLHDWNQVTDYNATIKLFETEEEYNNSVEKTRIIKLLCEMFSYGQNNNHLSLEQLQKILEIVKA